MLKRLQNLMPSRAEPPDLTMSRRVVDKIVANALIYRTETGETLIGLIRERANTEPMIYVLDTIPPDHTASRGYEHFEQGDDLQGDKFTWLWDNWRVMLETGAVDSRWRLPLTNLGDWHKHPGTLTTPSWGDTRTAIDQISDENTDLPELLVVLATVWDRAELDYALRRLSNGEISDDDLPDDEVPDASDNTSNNVANDTTRGTNNISNNVVNADLEAGTATLQITPNSAVIPAGTAESPVITPNVMLPNVVVPDDGPDRPLISYEKVTARAIGKQVLPKAPPIVLPIVIPVASQVAVRIDCWYMSRNMPRFQKVQAVVVAEDQLPQLPRMNWTLDDVARSEAERTALHKVGYAVSAYFENIDGKPPLQTCFTLAKPTAAHILIAATAPDYPVAPPRLYTVPLAALRGLPEGSDLWAVLWKQATPLPAELFPFAWHADRTLLDLAQALEARLARPEPIKENSL